MDITLKQHQIDHISRLIKLKGVSYYDVNMELTDHIASEVEDLMEERSLEYMNAVKKVFLRYGRHHFTKIEEAQEKKLRKQARKLFIQSFVQFFTFPKLILTVFIFYCSIILIQYVNLKGLFWFCLVIGLILGVFLDVKRRKLLGKRDFLYLRSMTFGGYLGGLCFIPQLLINGGQTEFFSSLEIPNIVLSGLLTLVLLIYMVFYEIYNDRISMLKMQYVK